MATANHNSPAIAKDIPTAGTAWLYFEEIKEQLNRIHAIACTAKLSEERVDEDHKDHMLITLFGLIEHIAEDWESVYRVNDFLKAASDAEVAAFEASKEAKNG
jgi:hypothetical protein